MAQSGEQESQARGSSVGWSFGDVSEVLPEFDLVKDNLDISQWVAKVEECGELYGWDDIAIQHFGLSKLIGVARR